jgi:hypothetical protein
MSDLIHLIIASYLLVLVATPMLKSFKTQWELVAALADPSTLYISPNVHNARTSNGSARSQHERRKVTVDNGHCHGKNG